MGKWKQGDVFRWSYNEKMLKKLNHGNNGGTTYWCKACIAIVQEDGRAVDVYWGSDSSNMHFTPCYAEENLELTYLGNLNEYDEHKPYMRSCYKDEDCLDINHANSFGVNFYIRKGAKQCNDKKRKIIQRSKLKLEKEIQYQLSQIKRYQELLDTKAYEEMQSLSFERDVSLNDESWMDEELN